MRSREIIAELEIMEAESAGLSYQGDNFISVVLAQAVKAKALHKEVVPGRRGAFYALPEWLNEEGKLNEKMRRNLL